MGKLGSMTHQVEQALTAQLRVGQSRHAAKEDEHTYSPQGIFSYGTLKTYLREGCRFASWTKQEHHCNTLDKARPYVEEYLQRGIDRGLSAATLSTQRAAICKIYGITANDLHITLPERRRADITRSRNQVARDKGFSVVHNQDIVDFARATGLRRHELAAVKPSNITVRDDGTVVLTDITGKGGKRRDVEVLPSLAGAVLRFADIPKDRRIFSRVPSHMDVHSYRREYADAMYRVALERMGPSGQVYRCRLDKRGKTYDRRAMRYVSNQLGHNRISVIAGHYLT
ncbi:hypothetical protein CE91St41_26740 [Oscillospiraceae bacterium]|nr:hypothetical protein CE91St40_10800 [Oscillospiraceae bacterium]BDF75785.1 hypothetical protein CE91St41_26740 [Oscillospiraceae bacterium]